MTLLKQLTTGEEPVDDFIRARLPDRSGSFGPARPGSMGFRRALVTLAREWELSQLQQQRGPVGGPAEGEHESASGAYRTGTESLNDALSLYAEYPRLRAALRVRIVRQLQARAETLKKVLGGASIPVAEHEDQVVQWLGYLALVESVYVTVRHRNPRIREFLAAVCRADELQQKVDE